jgi:hypothetical protein
MWMLYLYVSRTTYNLMLDKPHFLGSFLPRMVIGINIRLKSYWIKNPLVKEGNKMLAFPTCSTNS